MWRGRWVEKVVTHIPWLLPTLLIPWNLASPWEDLQVNVICWTRFGLTPLDANVRRHQQKLFMSKNEEKSWSTKGQVDIVRAMTCAYSLCILGQTQKKYTLVLHFESYKSGLCCFKALRNLFRSAEHKMAVLGHGLPNLEDACRSVKGCLSKVDWFWRFKTEVQKPVHVGEETCDPRALEA